MLLAAARGCCGRLLALALVAALWLPARPVVAELEFGIEVEMDNIPSLTLAPAERKTVASIVKDDYFMFTFRRQHPIGDNGRWLAVVVDSDGRYAGRVETEILYKIEIVTAKRPLAEFKSVLRNLRSFVAEMMSKDHKTRELDMRFNNWVIDSNEDRMKNLIGTALEVPPELRHEWVATESPLIKTLGVASCQFTTGVPLPSFNPASRSPLVPWREGYDPGKCAGVTDDAQLQNVCWLRYFLEHREASAPEEDAKLKKDKHEILPRLSCGCAEWKDEFRAVLPTQADKIETALTAVGLCKPKSFVGCATTRVSPVSHQGQVSIITEFRATAHNSAMTAYLQGTLTYRQNVAQFGKEIVKEFDTVRPLNKALVFQMAQEIEREWARVARPPNQNRQPLAQSPGRVAHLSDPTVPTVAVRGGLGQATTTFK